ncbi:MAG: hypothetical protein KAX33_10240 [Candidatus Lokiarchaeota archaeon]|nr:hypothetical protein [Candidatus Lokiarchaeota archaeon]
MSFEILELMKKKGFKDTLQILSKRKDYKINKHTFYKELNKFSYYNSFLRVKDILLNRDIIYVKKNKNKKLEISLTPKGVVILEKIEELNELFTKGNGII